MKTRLLVALAILIVGGVLVTLPGWSRPLLSYWRGYQTQRILLQKLDGATSVRLVEHSHPDDTPFRDPKGFQEEIYKTKILSSEERSWLRSAFALARDFSDTRAKACAFVPHHRIEFQQKGTITPDVYEICFTCGDHRLMGDRKRLLPDGWQQKLEDLFRTMSFDPNRGRH